MFAPNRAHRARLTPAKRGKGNKANTADAMDAHQVVENITKNVTNAFGDDACGDAEAHDRKRSGITGFDQRPQPVLDGPHAVTVARAGSALASPHDQIDMVSGATTEPRRRMARVRALLFNYLATPEDSDTLVTGLKLVREVHAKPALAPFSGTELSPEPEIATDAQIETWVRSNAGNSYHPTSTCRMGPVTNPVTVVDSTVGC